MNTTVAAKPVPRPNELSEPYWSGLKRGVLMLQRCAACKKVRHYPRDVCDSCYSMQIDWVQASGRGEVFSWTVAHHAYHPAFADDLPYTLVTVTLEEGVRAMGRLHGMPASDLRLGLALQFFAEVRDDGLALPAFKPR
jgi:uncharacterized protein